MIGQARHLRQGFTIIELVFVLLLLSLITTVAIPKVSSTMGLNIKSHVLRVSGFMETAYQQAVLSHEKVRLNFDLDTGKYWADTVLQTQGIPLINENTDLDEILNTFRKRAEDEDALDEEEKLKLEAQNYQVVETELLHPSKMSKPLKFKSVYFPGKDETKTEGVVSFFISSSGVNDRAVIHITHGDDVTYSIIFPPITGKPRIERGEVNADDL